MISEVGNAENFYACALERIRRTMALLAVVFAAAAYLRFGVYAALGFALGCVVAYVSFDSLKGAVEGLADRITMSENRRSARGVVLGFALRYVLVGAVGYAILRGWPGGLEPFLVGLTLPVAAIACEAIYEVYLVFARDV